MIAANPPTGASAEPGALGGGPGEALGSAGWPERPSRGRRRLLPSGMGMRRLSIGPSGGGRRFAARSKASGEPATGTRAGCTITAAGWFASCGACAQAVGAAPMASTATAIRPKAATDRGIVECPSMKLSFAKTTTNDVLRTAVTFMWGEAGRSPNRKQIQRETPKCKSRHQAATRGSPPRRAVPWRASAGRSAAAPPAPRSSSA